MNRIDRLLLKARREFNGAGKQVTMGFVSLQDNGQWKARADLWDGKPASFNPDTDELISYHATQEEAVACIKTLMEAYAPQGKKHALIEDPVILIDDIGMYA